MIPVYKKYEEEILQLSNREDLKNYLMSIEMGELLYKLKLIEIYLSRNKYEVWIKMFVESEGYSVLEDILWEVKSR